MTIEGTRRVLASGEDIDIAAKDMHLNAGQGIDKSSNIEHNEFLLQNDGDQIKNDSWAIKNENNGINKAELNNIFNELTDIRELLSGS